MLSANGTPMASIKAAVRKARWKTGTSAAPVAPAGVNAEITVTSTATPTPPAT